MKLSSPLLDEENRYDGIFFGKLNPNIKLIQKASITNQGNKLTM